jgi:thiamine-phosphate pyrophosphorylase
MIEGGVDLIQLRGKERPIEELVDLASALHELTVRSSTPLIVNDYVEIAIKFRGRRALDKMTTRSQLYGGEWVAKYWLENQLAASIKPWQGTRGADYLGFGPIFATPTKPDYQPIGLKEIEDVHRDVVLPIFCIGGIKIDNLKDVITAGARRVAIVSGLLQAPDIAGYARTCKNLLNPAI